jgi:predicted TIM-barrel fold metal-dependent hydrolase
MRINDELARIVAAYPGKFVGFGTIGFGDPHRAIAEIDRCVNQLGLKGLQIFSNIAGKTLDTPECRRCCSISPGLSFPFTCITRYLSRESAWTAQALPVGGVCARREPQCAPSHL